MLSYRSVTHRGSYNLLLLAITPTVGCGQHCCTGFTVAGHGCPLCGAAHGQCVYAVGITITVAVVPVHAAVPRGPDENGTQAATALQNRFSCQLSLETI